MAGSWSLRSTMPIRYICISSESSRERIVPDTPKRIRHDLIDACARHHMATSNPERRSSNFCADSSLMADRMQARYKAGTWIKGEL
jgi:hypothetical protein